MILAHELDSVILAEDTDKFLQKKELEEVFLQYRGALVAP
jgi:hypothetical protein